MKSLVYRSPLGGPRRFAPWLNALGKMSGAYVIRNARTKRTLYVGESHSGRLADTLKRHFWTWNDAPERKHFVYDPSRVEVAVRVTPPTSAIGAQNNLIDRLDPRDNSQGVAEEPF